MEKNLVSRVGEAFRKRFRPADPVHELRVAYAKFCHAGTEGARKRWHAAARNCMRYCTLRELLNCNWNFDMVPVEMAADWEECQKRLWSVRLAMARTPEEMETLGREWHPWECKTMLAEKREDVVLEAIDAASDKRTIARFRAMMPESGVVAFRADMRAKTLSETV